MKTKSPAFLLRQGKCVGCGGFLIGAVSDCGCLVCANCAAKHQHLTDEQNPKE